ncbi:hypothetical protein TNCV_1996591 [Trichonephila clavipes]|uniref:Uncharacterized protein n=1 Tax=Trichonephila clavipes TaxID=2585209 RepID=A0A8X6RXT9_TRICX|nr:hypothetical protein TNCV_1996591 [Trichonephila clavipes]
MLTVFGLPKMQDNIDNFILQLDGAAPHWSATVSPVLTLRDFLLWGYIKDADLTELKHLIAATIDEFDSDTLIRTWEEMDYLL